MGWLVYQPDDCQLRGTKSIKAEGYPSRQWALRLNLCILRYENVWYMSYAVGPH
jgi:hypothetical protein